MRKQNTKAVAPASKRAKKSREHFNTVSAKPIGLFSNKDAGGTTRIYQRKDGSFFAETTLRSDWSASEWSPRDKNGVVSRVITDKQRTCSVSLSNEQVVSLFLAHFVPAEIHDLLKKAVATTAKGSPKPMLLNATHYYAGVYNDTHGAISGRG